MLLTFVQRKLSNTRTLSAVLRSKSGSVPCPSRSSGQMISPHWSVPSQCQRSLTRCVDSRSAASPCYAAQGLGKNAAEIQRPQPRGSYHVVRCCCVTSVMITIARFRVLEAEVKAYSQHHLVSSMMNKLRRLTTEDRTISSSKVGSQMHSQGRAPRSFFIAGSPFILHCRLPSSWSFTQCTSFIHIRIYFCALFRKSRRGISACTTCSTLCRSGCPPHHRCHETPLSSSASTCLGSHRLTSVDGCMSTACLTSPRAHRDVAATFRAGY
jgi:hypothetical protein